MFEFFHKFLDGPVRSKTFWAGIIGVILYILNLGGLEPSLDPRYKDIIDTVLELYFLVTGGAAVIATRNTIPLDKANDEIQSKFSKPFEKGW